jgi:hypothetical protein
MTKSNTLKIEIDTAIEKIKLLTKNEKLEVYNIFSNVYKLYLNLPKEEFINDFYYQTYKKSIIISKPLFEEELKSLLENNDADTNTSDNFFQIKVSLLMMSPEKLTK